MTRDEHPGWTQVPSHFGQPQHRRGAARGQRAKGGAEPGWRPIAYFARMEQAIDFLLERHIKASEAMTLQELANDIHSARTALYEAIRTAGEGLQATLQL
ncbi:hypothetical protein GCM10025857_15200 [Alicyclobacillus contaminans]|nr:hypothetical protein GCM10025857_15200 [Alicyclobacillus contaminans]